MRRASYSALLIVTVLASLSANARAEGAPGEDPPNGRRVHTFRYLSSTGTPAATAGQGDSVQRTGPGLYTVFFPGAAWPVEQGNVQVSTFGAVHGYCNADSWEPTRTPTPGETIRIRCFDAAGRPQDTGFSVVYVAQRDDPPNSNIKYGWIAFPLSQSPTNRVPVAYRSPSFFSAPTRTSTGSYIVRATSGYGSQSVWFATPTGPLPRRCRGFSNPSTLGVGCYALDASETPMDASVSFMVLSATTLSPWLRSGSAAAAGGYARFAATGQLWGSTGTGYYAWASNGGRVSSTHDRPGQYRVHLERLGAPGGVALVSSGCRVVSLGVDALDQIVNIDCNGIDRDFDVAYVR